MTEEQSEYKVLRKEMMSESINELATALAKAQAELQHAKKDSKNPFFKSSYADLTSVIEAIRKPFSANGLSYCQLPETEDGKIKVITILMHSSGQWIKGELTLTPVKTDPQSYGSAITYGRRYGLQAIAGLSAEEDDDGNKASGNTKTNGEPSKFEQWEIKAQEVCEAAKTAESIAKWWPENKEAILKDVGKAQAAKIYEMVNLKQKELKAAEREPGSEG